MPWGKAWNVLLQPFATDSDFKSSDWVGRGDILIVKLPIHLTAEEHEVNNNAMMEILS